MTKKAIEAIRKSCGSSRQDQADGPVARTPAGSNSAAMNRRAESSCEARAWIRVTSPSKMKGTVYTVGHSTHPIEQFVWLLTRHEITAVADVRSQPYSRMNPQFNRETLRTTLRDLGIAYVFLGKELGARSSDESCYINGKVQYDRLATTTLFRDGLSRVEQGLSRHRIALMCAEKDPLTCHRSILVCRHLIERQIGIAHILEDGRVESQEAALGRLLRELRIESTDLFRNQSDLFAEAYALRGEEIAYVDKSAAVVSRASR